MTAATATTATPAADPRESSLAGARAWFAEKGLSRPREGRSLAGVFAAFTRRYDVNPLVGRVLGIATIVILSPLVYVGAWILIPNDAE